MQKTQNKKQAKRSSKPSDPKTNDTLQMVYESYRNLIWHRAITYYRMLPQHIQKQVDVEDFVQEGYVFAAKRMKSHYCSNTSKASTYLYSILNNFYKNLLSSYTNKSRGAVTVTIDVEFQNTRLGRAYRPEESIDAQRIARRFHEMASVSLVEYLDRTLFNPKERQKIVLCNSTFKHHAKEFRELVSKTGMTIEQYRAAIHIHQALNHKHADKR